MALCHPREASRYKVGRRRAGATDPVSELQVQTAAPATEGDIESRLGMFDGFVESKIWVLF